MDTPWTESFPAALESRVRAYRAGNNRIRAIGECRTGLNCGFDAAHSIVRLIERLPYGAEEIRDAIQKVAVTQIPSATPSTETNRTDEANRMGDKTPSATMAGLANCKACGKQVSKTALTCPHCGVSLPGSMATCPKCGSLNLSMGQKGFGLGKAAAGAVLLGPIGLLGGMIGRKKAELQCQSCGHHWSP